MPRGGPRGVALEDKENRGQLWEAGFAVPRGWGAAPQLLLEDVIGLFLGLAGNYSCHPGKQPRLVPGIRGVVWPGHLICRSRVGRGICGLAR